MIAGVVLAAGGSRRMGRDKALLRAGRETYLTRAVRRLWTVSDHVVIVLGAHADRIRAAAEHDLAEYVRLRPRASRGGAPPLEARFVVNRLWRQGMLSSARAGLAAALAARPAAVLLLPVDHPAIAAATIGGLAQVVLGAMAECRARDLASFRYALIPRHLGRRGHPVALTAALARAIARDDEAEDLSDAVRRSARLVGYLDVRDAGVIFNHNRPRSARRA